MNKQKIIISTIAAALMFSSAGVSAQDVYVDLSVLDGLGSDSSVSSPLFPVVAAQPAPVKKTTPKTIKKARPEKADKVNIPSKNKISVNNLKPADEPDLSSEAVQIKDQPVNKEAAAAARNNMENVEKSSEDLSPTAVPDIDNNPIVQEPLSEEKVDADEKNIVVETSKASEEPVQEPQNLMTPSEIKPLLPVNPAEENTAKVIAPVEPLPAADVKNFERNIKQITFADGVSELEPAQQQQIDNLIAGFDNPKNNKIAIFSYNYDNGEDVFKKKRISLNRAVEIRSYLLGKGYKNFSIKVINVTESDKNNLVVIEELK